jgi:hypothetical protein
MKLVAANDNAQVTAIRARGDVLPASLPPRGLRREEAAAYCGCNTTRAFDEWVRRGIVPPPIPGTKRWDRKAIDAAIDKASGLSSDSHDSESPEAALDQWRSKHARAA